MKKYRVTLISKDGQQAEFFIHANLDDEAVDTALGLIKEKGWDVYEYKLKQLERIS